MCLHSITINPIVGEFVLKFCLFFCSLDTIAHLEWVVFSKLLASLLLMSSRNFHCLIDSIIFLIAFNFLIYYWSCYHPVDIFLTTGRYLTVNHRETGRLQILYLFINSNINLSLSLFSDLCPHGTLFLSPHSSKLLIILSRQIMLPLSDNINLNLTFRTLH